MCTVGVPPGAELGNTALKVFKVPLVHNHQERMRGTLKLVMPHFHRQQVSGCPFHHFSPMGILSLRRRHMGGA